MTLKEAMIVRFILFSLLLISPAYAYQEMKLKPVYIEQSSVSKMQQGRTYNYHEGSRILAAKKASFPILDQYEKLLFPQKDFSKEKAKARLERIEIAVHGNIQKGSVKHRLNLLENEITAWQIANYQTLKILNTQEKDPHAFSYQNYQAKAQPHYQANPYQQPRIQTISNRQRKVDYDYENYRMANPIIRDIGRRSVRALFDL